MNRQHQVFNYCNQQILSSIACTLNETYLQIMTCHAEYSSFNCILYLIIDVVKHLAVLKNLDFKPALFFETAVYDVMV